MNLRNRIIWLALVSLFLLLPSCKDNEAIQVYRVSKPEPESPPRQSFQEQAPSLPESSGTPPMGELPPMGSDSTTGHQSEFSGKPPSDWMAQPLTSMREASYLVKGDQGAVADISLVILEGSAGGVLENVNRWLSQIGQPPIMEEQMSKIAQHVSSQLGDVTVVDLVGLPPGADATKEGRIIAGIVSDNSRTYFFKMHGNASLAEAQKKFFIQWIASVQGAQSASKTAHP